jgi:hypothetical protein
MTLSECAETVLYEVAAAQFWASEFSTVLRSQKNRDSGQGWVLGQATEASIKTHGLIRSSMQAFGPELSMTCTYREGAPLIRRRRTLSLGLSLEMRFDMSLSFKTRSQRH